MLGADRRHDDPPALVLPAQALDLGVADVGTDTWTSGGQTTSARVPGCGIVFFARAGTLSVFGAWARGTVRRWTGPVRGRSTPRPTLGLAAVAADGTVHVR